MMESHPRDSVSLSVSHITSAGNWNVTERIGFGLSRTALCRSLSSRHS